MSTWSKLPLLLMDKVLRRLQTPDLVQLWLVCKSWKAACTEFSGSAIGQIRHQQEMFGLCAALPNLSTLALNLNTDVDFPMLRLRACSNLVDVALHYNSLHWNDGRAPTLDFSYLPASVRKLTVSCLELCGSGLYCHGGSLAGLTSLELKWRQGNSDIIEAMWNPLADIPKLKELCLGTFIRRKYRYTPLHGFGCLPRYTSLTRLELSRSLLLESKCGEHEGPWDLPALLELHLDDMRLNGFWMTFIATSLTTLTQLTFASCWLNEDFEIVTAADSVRKLNLVAQHDFLGIAGPALQQLKYVAVAIRGASSAFCKPIDWVKMAQLRGLTKLEITDYNHPDEGGPYLLSEALVELVLIFSMGIVNQLFVPGAFPNLEKLHIEDGRDRNALEAVREGRFPKVALAAKRLRGAGVVILGLPKLRQISGGCLLFSTEMKEGLQNWDHTLLKTDPSKRWAQDRDMWTRK